MKMRDKLGVLLWFVALGCTALLAGCTTESQLAERSAHGAIHEGAPVTAHVQVEIASPPERVWGLLVHATEWPRWQSGIESVEAPGALVTGTRFRGRAGGLEIRSEVHLCEPERRLSWTGTALTARAIHVWELTPEAGGGTLVKVSESMDGPLMAALYPSEKLREADLAWLMDLKQAAQQTR